MKTTNIAFKNYFDETTQKFENIEISGCLVANNGSPNASRPQIVIHLPKNDSHDVDGSFVDYDGKEYHIIGTTAKQMDENTPTPWNRYCIGETIKAL